MEFAAMIGGLRTLITHLRESRTGTAMSVKNAYVRREGRLARCRLAATP